MTTISGEKPLELSVRNFGPIAEADIELRPLTVFVGPSNTGKSYLATLIYALHQFFATRSGLVGHKNSYGALATSGIQSIYLSEQDIADLYSWADSVWPRLDPTRTPRLLPYECDLPESLSLLVRRAISTTGLETKFLDEELTRCFGTDHVGRLARYPRAVAAEVVLQRSTPRQDDHHTFSLHKIDMAENGTELHRVDNDYMAITVPPDLGRPWFLHPRGSAVAVDANEQDALWLLNIYAGLAVSHGGGPLGLTAYYLPADRAGVMHAHQVAVRGLIASASRVAFRRESPMPVLSGVLGDFMEEIVFLASEIVPPKRGVRDDLALQLENALIGGEIRVDRTQIDYPSLIYRPHAWTRDLPLMNASSMISELAPVILYLRNVVLPSETLIIEEPEAHLHPAAQVEFTRQLASAVKAGIRIIITTHSEWVLEELANLVLMSELPEDRREGLEGADVALSPNDVGAWLFEPDESLDGGTVVREIPLDKEMGNFDSGFGLITTDLYNRYATISNRIEHLKEK